MKKLLHWGVVPTRLLLGAVFFTAGMAKIWPDHQFPGLIGPVWLIEQLEKHQLGTFAAFVAWSQIIIGFMLMTQRFARLGAVMLVPMLLNILLVTISQQWQGTPYIISIFLLMNMYLLLMDFEVLKWLLSDQKNTGAKYIRSNYRKDGLFLVATGIVVVSPLLAHQNLGLGIVAVVSGLVLVWLNQFLPRP